MSFKNIKNIFKRNSISLVGVCCLLFAGLSLLEKWLEPVLSRDGVFYLQLVEIWRNAGHYTAIPSAIPDAYWIPAFPLFLIKVLADCGISPEVAGVGISMVVGSTLPMLIYLMAQEIQSDKRISLAASMLMAFNPSMIELACEIQRDMLYIGLCGWAIFFGLKGLRQKKVWPWIPAGILGALSALTRYETFELIPIVIVIFLIFGFKKVLTWRKIGLQCSVLVMTCTLTGWGMILVMGIQDTVTDTYANYFQGKVFLLEQKIAPEDKK